MGIKPPEMQTSDCIQFASNFWASQRATILRIKPDYKHDCTSDMRAWISLPLFQLSYWNLNCIRLKDLVLLKSVPLAWHSRTIFNAISYNPSFCFFILAYSDASNITLAVITLQWWISSTVKLYSVQVAAHTVAHIRANITYPEPLWYLYIFFALSTEPYTWG